MIPTKSTTLVEIASLVVSDEDITSIDTIMPTHQSVTAAEIQGPITRARARQLNYQVNSFLGIHTHILKDGMLFNPSIYVLLFRNQGPETCKLKYGREEGKFVPDSPPEQGYLVSGTTAASGLQLACGSTLRKDLEVYFPMDPASSKKST